MGTSACMMLPGEALLAVRSIKTAVLMGALIFPEKRQRSFMNMWKEDFR